MEFGLTKCGVLLMKRGKVEKIEGIKLPSGKVMKGIEEGGYWKFEKEYLRRSRLVLGTKLNGRSKMLAVNTWAITLLRYGAGAVKWNQEELRALDRKTRKLLTLHVWSVSSEK